MAAELAYVRAPTARHPGQITVYDKGSVVERISDTQDIMVLFRLRNSEAIVMTVVEFQFVAIKIQ